MADRPHQFEWDEIGKIDFLLDELARGVERGEVPYSAYEALSRRHLARRQSLVAIISGMPIAPEPAARPTADMPPAMPTGSATAMTERPSAAMPEWPATSEPARVMPTLQPRPRPERKPVPWTTVLTFLGAFLVVAAAAIFAVIGWDIMGVAGRLTLMGALTAGFYAGGWWARKAGLKVGGTALTAVGSAMLLFEGWIAIDGLKLEGPLPWAALLFVCSAVYWFTEVKLAERFYGVVGAAAQVGWWWLLTAGLDVTTPVRLAGIAGIAVLWQLAGERGRESQTVGSLARVLEYAAPVAVAGAGVGLLGDLVFIGTAGVTEVACAAATSLAAGVVFWRTRVVADRASHLLAAIAQGLVLVAGWLAAGTTGDSWWIVAIYAVLALGAHGFAILRAGAPFSVVGMVAEASLVLEACAVLGASDRTRVFALVVLALTWILSGWLIRRNREPDQMPLLAQAGVSAEWGAVAVLVAATLWGVGSGLFWGSSWWFAASFALVAVGFSVLEWVRSEPLMGVPKMAAELLTALQVCAVLDAVDNVTVLAVGVLAVAWAARAVYLPQPEPGSAPADGRRIGVVGAFGLLVLVSLATVAVAESPAMLGSSIPRDDALLAVGALACWFAAAAISVEPIIAYAGAAYSFYALASILSWALPDQRPEVYGLALALLAGVWIASARSLSDRYGELWARITVWSGRVAVIGLAVVPLIVSADQGLAASWFAPLLTLVAALILAVDAWRDPTEFGALAAPALAVLTGALVGRVAADGLAVEQAVGWSSVGAAAVAAAVAAACVAVRAKQLRFTGHSAVAAAVAGSLIALESTGEYGYLAGALAIIAVAWALVSIVTTEWLMVVSGAALYGSVLFWLACLDPQPWVTVAALAATGVALGAVSFTPAGGPDGPHRTTSLALTCVGLGASVLTAAGLWVSAGDALGAGVRLDTWADVGAHGVAVLALVLGAHGFAQAARWRFEPGYYAAGFAVLAACWIEVGQFDMGWTELYTTPLALYLVACAYLSARLAPQRPFPVALDYAAAAIGLGIPLVAGLTAPAAEANGHALWILGLSLVAIGGGVAAKSRAYFFGGVGALSAVAVYRSFIVLVEVWWLLLGIVGLLLLVIALTWERQRVLMADTRARLRSSFEGWR